MLRLHKYMFRKILLSLLAFLVLFSGSLFPSLVSYSHAQDTSWYNQTYEEWVEKVADDNNPDEIFGERYTAAQVRWILYSLVWILMGGDESVTTCITQHNGNLIECVSVIESAVGPLNTVDSNIDGRSKNIFLAVFRPRPISTATYFKDVASRFKLVPEAKAQGFGFGAASPVLGLWRMVRNVTYFLLIIAVIALSFMIMFRIRLTPQTIITVQSALPKLIIALILITFSYAIVGFLIDLMYVVIGLIAGIITTSGIVGIPYANNWSNMFEALTERS
ncbi:hypothetical protein KA005_77565, partial [bacterium]|nr:hypothetical protein [bacterium]